MSTKSEYYTLLLHNLQLDDGSVALTRKLHKYLGKKFKILQKEKKN
jgi:seryl-tRNA synthetase